MKEKACWELIFLILIITLICIVLYDIFMCFNYI